MVLSALSPGETEYQIIRLLFFYLLQKKAISTKKVQEVAGIFVFAPVFTDYSTACSSSGTTENDSRLMSHCVLWLQKRIERIRFPSSDQPESRIKFWTSKDNLLIFCERGWAPSTVTHSQFVI